VESGRSENLSIPLRHQNSDVMVIERIVDSKAIGNERVGLSMATKQAIVSFSSTLSRGRHERDQGPQEHYINCHLS
jgi:hypothetical protein